MFICSVFLCACLSLYVRVCAFVCACVYVRMYVCVCLCVKLCVYVCVCVCVYNVCVCVGLGLVLRLCGFVSVWFFMCGFVSECVYNYVFVTCRRLLLLPKLAKPYLYCFNCFGTHTLPVFRILTYVRGQLDGLTVGQRRLRLNSLNHEWAGHIYIGLYIVGSL